MPRGSAAKPPAGHPITKRLFEAPLSASELGSILGISERRVRELRDQGSIPDAGAGKYRLGEAVRAYCATLRPATGRGAAGGASSAADLDAARIRLTNAQADAREMLNAQMRGETILAEDLEVVAGALCDAVRAKVLALPTRAAPLVLGLASLPEVREVLTGLVHEACADLAASAIVTTSEDRAARRAGRGLDDEEDSPEVRASAASHG
jgi:phage terminase Nu1 subunit (DNA packaging protein)